MSSAPIWYSIRRLDPKASAAAGAVSAAVIFIYGDIGESWWEETTSAASFVSELTALDVDQITIRINSYGGSVTDGLAIYNAIRRHPAHVTVAIDGCAYSIASLIAMAGDTVEMAENALLMIHAPWTGVYGNANDLRDMADALDMHARAMATSYAAKTGRDHAEMLAWLTDGKDHYFTAAQALEEKLIDATAAAMPVAASARFDQLRRLRAAALQQPGQQAATQTPAATPAAPTTENPAMPDPTDQAAIEAAKKEALAKDKARREGIRAAVKPFLANVEHGGEIAKLQVEAEDNPDFTVEMVNARALEILARGVTSAAGHVVTVEAEADKHRSAVVLALSIRAGLAKNDTANPFRGYTLLEHARAALERLGIKTAGMDKMALVASAFTHSTSDFGNLLANVAEKSMLKGASEADESFQRWTSRGTLPDFKTAQRVDIGEFPSLAKVAEGAEFKYVTLGDYAEPVVLGTYGNLFSITRQAIINDDLDGFTKIPRKFGRAALRTVGDLAYAILTANPIMADGTVLFHASHGNLAGAGSVISTASVDAARVAMATQKLVGQTSGSANIRLAHLLVPVALEGLANTVRDSEYEVGASTKNNTVPNSVRGTFDVISDARLDAASSISWYGAASEAITDTVEIQYLDGNDSPTLEQQAGWSVDGVDFKVRIDAGAKALGFKGLFKNPGA